MKRRVTGFMLLQALFTALTVVAFLLAFSPGALPGVAPALVFAFLFAAALSVLIAGRLTVLLARPINTIDLDHPTENDVCEELSPLLARLRARNERINQQLQTMAAQSRAFDTITENMAEGLVALAGDGVVLSVNRSGARLFDVTTDSAVGKHYMALTRDLSVRDAVELALSGSAAEAKLRREGRVYQLLANPVMTGRPAGGTGGVTGSGKEVTEEIGKTTANGAILLLLNVTEREQAEEARREFSANVSHELKTPLTAITGYAEMLAMGMIRPEDTAETADKIYTESKRMIALIEDIIALSKLDERQTPVQEEPVALLSLARDVAALLADAAEARKISVMVMGEEAVMVGVRSVLSEMLFNLVENGIKYNRQGGEVRINVVKTHASVDVTVADTGIGITPEHQERVFERFYRVEKSHNRGTGGTGLGLSIVKHGALMHNAKVTLQSKAGEGTEITVTFFKDQNQ